MIVNIISIFLKLTWSCFTIFFFSIILFVRMKSRIWWNITSNIWELFSSVKNFKLIDWNLKILLELIQCLMHVSDMWGCVYVIRYQRMQIISVFMQLAFSARIWIILASFYFILNLGRKVPSVIAIYWIQFL